MTGLLPSAFTVPEGRRGPLLDLLCERFPRIPREEWASRCRRGRVLDAAGAALAENAPCGPGTRILYFREVEEEAPPPEPERILYEDPHLLVADKPHRMAVTPGGRDLRHCLLHRLRAATGNPVLSPVHRLDRDTAGLVLFAKTREALSTLGRLFDDRTVEKAYEALARVMDAPAQREWRVESRLEPGDPWFTMREAPGPPNARTRVSLEEVRDGIGLFRIHPETGRKHQIRVHMAGLGYPILHDPFYPVCHGAEEARLGPPLQLLARSLAFRHPLSGEVLTFRSTRELRP